MPFVAIFQNCHQLPSSVFYKVDDNGSTDCNSECNNKSGTRYSISQGMLLKTIQSEVNDVLSIKVREKHFIDRSKSINNANRLKLFTQSTKQTVKQ